MSDQITTLKDVIIGSCTELLPLYGLDCRFLCELGENTLNSGEEISIILGLAHGVQGSIAIGLTDTSAKQIAAAVMGMDDIPKLNKNALKKLAEFAGVLGAKISTKLSENLGVLVVTTMPTVVTGQHTYLLISRAPAKKVFFKFGESKFNIAYCLE